MIRHKMKLALWEAQGRACCICDKYLAEPKPESTKTADSPTKDHVIPRSAGGGLVLLAHHRCNARKGNRPPTERELKRIETTLAALTPRALSDLLNSCVDRVQQHKAQVGLAAARLKSAEETLMVVLRYAPTEQAAKALARLQA